MCTLKMPVAKAGKTRASAGARIAHCLLEFAGRVQTHSDASSETFQLRRAEMPAEVAARADPSIPHPADGVWWPLARLQGLPLERGSPPVVARGEGDWRVLETVGDVSRGQVWTKTDRYCDLGGAAGVRMADDCTGDILAWWLSAGLGLASPRPCLSMVLEFSLLPFCLSELTGLDARFGCGVKLSNYWTETNPKDWPVVGRRTLAWCARWSTSSAPVLAFHSETREARLGRRVSRTRLAPVGKGRLL